MYDLRLLIETESVQRLCEGSIIGDSAVSQAKLEQLALVWLVPKSRRLRDSSHVSQLDEAFHCALVEATGNAEMLRVHRDITDRIRVIRKLDFTQGARIETTYDEHAKILQAILSKRTEQSRLLLKAHVESSQLEVRKITLHQLQMARLGKT